MEQCLLPALPLSKKHVIEHLPRKCEALSSNPSPAKTTTKKKHVRVYLTNLLPKCLA
jgi:hypothetical protein